MYISYLDIYRRYFNKMSRYLANFLLLIYVISTARAQNPCDSLDAGPYLGTKPTLQLRVFEATKEDLHRFPNSKKYRDELRLVGKIGSPGPDGISLEVMEDFRFFDPRDVFSFETEAVTGKNLIKLTKALDRDGPTASLEDDVNFYSFTLKCIPAANTSNHKFYDTKIQVLDVNDNYPDFVGAPYRVSINELTSVGVTVLHISATDKDFNLFGNMTYEIVPQENSLDDGSDRFEINHRKGDVTVKKNLDYDHLPRDHKFYTLRVKVTDGGRTEKKTAQTMVTIDVTDGDDHGPVFVYKGCFQHRTICAWPKYTTHINKMKQGEPITVYPVPNKISNSVDIEAKDLDPSGSSIKFSIASTIPPGFENHFQVDTKHNSGSIYRAVITQVKSFQPGHGFEIFLKAEEQTYNMRHEIAMIFFMGTDPEEQKQGKTLPTKEGKSESKFTETNVALIVVVAILAAFVICLATAFMCYVSKRGSKSAHKYHSQDGYRVNGATTRL